MSLSYKPFLILFLLYSNLFTQIFFADDTIKINQSSFVSSYSKFLNIHNYAGTILSNYELYNFEFKLLNRFTSIITDASIKNIRDENVLDGIWGYKLNKNYSTGLWYQSKIINDDRKVGISKFKDNGLKFFFSISPVNSINITPFYGFKQEEQLENLEHGQTFGFISEIDNLTFTQNRFDSKLRYVNDNLTLRKTRIINSEINFINIFGNKFKLLSRLQFNKIGRDYYLNIDSATAQKFNVRYNLEYRVDNLFLFNEKIELIELIPNSFITVNGDVYYRLVDKNTRYKNLDIPSKNIFDTKISEFKFDLGLELKISQRKYESINRINYFERSEKHTVKRIQSVPDFLLYQRINEEQQKNNFSTRITLTSVNKINIFNKDTLQFDLAFSKLRYDTPPLESYLVPLDIFRDDRDELMYILKIELKKYFSPEFNASFLMESYNNHLVYIFKERSSNNNWNRVLRFSTQTSYSSSVFKTKNRVEVLANYTVYDFEDVIQTIKSYAFRQFGFTDSTSVYITRKIFADGYYSLKLSEQGILNWRSFSSFPSRFLQEQQTELKLGYRFSLRSYISAGARMTYFGEFTFNGKERILNYDIKSLGPLLEMSLFYREDFHFNLKIWVEYIRQTNLPSRRNVNFNFNSLIVI